MATSYPFGEHEIMDFDPRNIPLRFQRAIGLIAASSAQTESVVENAIAGMLGVDGELGWAITTHMTSPLRDSVLRSVAEIQIDDLDALDHLDDLLDAVHEAFERRNGYIHNSWCVQPRTGKVFTVKIKARTRVETDLLEMSIDEIKTDAAFIYKAGMDLYQFLMDRDLLPSLPPGPRPRGHKSKVARKARRKALGEKK